jgi:coronin-1B/1C/6
MRAYKTVNDAYIEPISFTVPRRAEVFQSDIYPPAIGTKPAVTASEWFSGKDGIPAKIDLESVYEGNAPVEVASDYKPPVAAPAPTPVKAPAPAKKENDPPVATRSPPPTMSEQKGSIAAMASKFQDDEVEDDDDETSSFEEIAKPIQKSVPAAAKAEPKPQSPIKPTPTKTEPPKPAPVSQATARSVQSPASSTPTTIPTSSGPISAVGSEGSVESSLQQIKSLLEAQTKTISAQSEKIGQLAQEVDTLKMRVGSGAQDQSERIRQLELELEAARS